MTDMLDATTPDLGAVKARQQAWASGDFAVVAARIVLVAEHLCDTADLQAGWRVPRRRHRQRQRRDRRGPPRLHGRRRRLRPGAPRSAAASGGGRGPGRRAA